MSGRENHIDSRKALTFVDDHYEVFAAAVLGLALFNLTFRLGHEFVNEWDESLYAISAWEALTRGSWIGTTFFGTLDYYNSKPPLMVWLIAIAFKTFGPSLTSLRLVSALSAWLTVYVLQRWTRRCFGAAVALIASLVLATTFGFVYVHSGRSAATDAPFTLVTLLAVVTMWGERERPLRRLWLGPVLAAAFLLRGMAVLMPITLVIVLALSRTRRRDVSWMPTFGALILFLVPVGAWCVARYRLDGWAFFERLFLYDFVARSVRPIEMHPGGPLYYLNILQKHHYDWLLAGTVALLLFPLPWRELPVLWAGWRRNGDARLHLIAWAAVTLAIPTVMRTKVPWYLNTFYPAFAVGLALIVERALSAAKQTRATRWRAIAHAAAFVLALCVAEGKLLWYSFHYRDVRLSRQSLMLAERRRLRGHRLFLEPHTRAGHFVAEALVGAKPQPATERTALVNEIRDGDYVLLAGYCPAPELTVVASSRDQFLCQRQVTRAEGGSMDLPPQIPPGRDR